MMRRLILPMGLLMLLLLGCGREIESEPLVVLSETDTTRTIEHTFGTTEAPANPQRIIALGEDGLLADLLDLGIAPVMSIVNVEDSTPQIDASELTGTDLYSSYSNISPETLIGYQPDLIIATTYFADRAGYDKLSTIAPTVSVTDDNALLQYIETAAVLGMRDEAEAQVADFREEISAEAERTGAADMTVSVGAIYGGPNVALFVDGPQPPPQMLSELGVTMLPTGEEREDLSIRNGRAFISEERLDLFSAERLIMLQTEAVDGEPEAFAEMMADPLWQQLPAVQADQVSIIDRLGYPGFRGQQALLADLVAVLEQ